MLALGTGWSTAHGGVVRGTWGAAVELPGIAALNQGGNAQTDSVSCASAGNCSVGGSYTDSSGAIQAFVASETHGTWGTAEEVPGTATLNQGGQAQVSEVSCASAGNCSAGGSYLDSSASSEAFVVKETHGTWGTAKEVPGTATLGGGAGVDALSCASAGNCSAGGSYKDISGHFQAFVVKQTHGTWGTAREMPGTATLNQGGDAHVGAMSCASAGNCSAGGSYTDGSGNTQVFVVKQTNGTWGTAEEVPGTATLNQGGFLGTQLDSVSCGSAGNCAAGGYYTDGSGHILAFVVKQTNGTWGTAKEVPGTANQAGFAQTLSVSCASAGNCSAGGNYADSSGNGQAFVVSETDGAWGASEEVPGIATLNQGGNATTQAVSCGAAGNCAAVGSYNAGAGQTQAFVVNETNGTWGTAEEVPGTATLNQGGNAITNAVSCSSAGHCTADGSYSDGSFGVQAFVVSEP
jgi:D-alanine-D-alanine ligase-like ATP-grasp enzyme